MQYDVIIIGAGASGLMAAWETIQTGRTTAVVEAGDRAGGRIRTIQPPGFEIPVEAGAEFVHGDLPLTQLLLKKAMADTYQVKGDIWQKADGRLREQKDFIEDYKLLEKKFNEIDTDLSIEAFMKLHLAGKAFENLRFSLKNYVEGYYAADISKASTLALKEELEQSGAKQYRIETGYEKLVDYLVHQNKLKGTVFYFSSPAERITWQKNAVEVSGKNLLLQSKQVLFTVPTAVLQEEKIIFSPAITEKMNAAKLLGYGPVIKILLQFSDPFWKQKERTNGKNLSKLGFIFSEETIPTWWTTYPRQTAILTGWAAGPHARKMVHLDHNKILEKAIASLSSIFDTPIKYLKEKLKAWHIANWPGDANGCYGYAYQVVNGPDLQTTIKEPLENTLYFAGEGLHAGPEIGTVEAALQTGKEAAHRLISLT